MCRLADVLAAAGVRREDGLHVEFLAPDVAQEARPVQSYGSSIPLEQGDVTRRCCWHGR